MPLPTSDEIANSYQKLSSTGSKAAVLRVVPGHCKAFRPTVLANNFPPILTDLFEQSHSKLPFNELLNKCDEVELSVTQEQSKCVEQATKTQSSNKLWFRFRSGRVTASKMKRICRSNPDQPSQSLVKAVCYPEAASFTVAATQWGCKHEEVARAKYVEQMQASHHNFQMELSGFVINPDFPHIGATPDGMVSCDCCGSGIVEIKCPYCARDSTVNEYATTEQRACVTMEGEEIRLKKDHEYMYQVQTQLNVCDKEYADFVLWTQADIQTQRIESDPTMWAEMVAASGEFFKKAILPELLGKFYSRSGMLSLPECQGQSPNNNPAAAIPEPSYCYCGGPEDAGDMIACDDDECKLQWYHLHCLKIQRVPKGKWFCPECRKSTKNKRSRNK